MSVFIKYLLSIAAHMMWRRMGKGGPIPPIPLPRKGPVNLPVLGPWQVMIGMWLMNKMWERYGRELKTHLMNAGNPVVRGAGNLLPDTGAGTSNAAAPGATPGTSNTTAHTHNAAPATNQVPSTPASNPAPTVNYKTQNLSDTAPASQASSAAPTSQRLPQGSILSTLRRTKSSNNQSAQG